MDWSDRPIRDGDPFIALGPCRVSSSTNVWLFKPEGTDSGRWARVPLTFVSNTRVSVGVCGSSGGVLPSEWGPIEITVEQNVLSVKQPPERLDAARHRERAVHEGLWDPTYRHGLLFDHVER
jgi:hypothetical protein